MSTVDEGEGADAVVYLATSLGLEDLTGQYFEDNKPTRAMPRPMTKMLAGDFGS